MYSNIVPFRDILEDIKDDTGITNIQNLLPKIRRLIYRVERDIGFGSTLLLKRMSFSLEDQTIIEENGRYRIRLPEDMLFLEKVGMCNEGLCDDGYVIQGNYLFLCHPINKFSLIYYAMICDGEGNPVVTENHREAVVSGVSYYMYRQRRFQDKGNFNTYAFMQQYYEDRIGEAKGDDAMPQTAAEWERISAMMNQSSYQMLYYSLDSCCFCCVPEYVNPNSNGGGGSDPTGNAVIYYWQFPNLTTNISFAPNIDSIFLDTRPYAPISVFENGFIVPYTEIGRIAFAIVNVNENSYRIHDIFNTDITDLVFDNYYNSALKIQIYISKEYYTHSNIFFKLIQT